MKWKVSLFFFIAFVLVTLITIIQTLPPHPLPANVSVVEFSARRAIQHGEAIARQPHPVGSAANDSVRRYIREALTDLGLETETQRNDALENVMGRILGTRSSDGVLLTAHFDSVPESPGAADDASGVAVLLETARALMSDVPMRNTVIFLFTDSEEGGYFGAKAFIDRHPWVENVRVVIGFDAGGLGGPSVLSATSDNNGWLIRQLAQADPYLTGSSAINALADSHTDFGKAFRPAGFSGYAFDVYWDRRHHTPEDNMNNLDLSIVQHQGHHALRLARHFGNLTQLADPKESDAVYFNVLRLYTVSYPSTWAIPLAIVVTGVFTAVLAFGVGRRILTWRGMSYGTSYLLAALIIAPLPNILIGQWVFEASSVFASGMMAQALHVSGVVSLTLILTILWIYFSGRIRGTSVPDLALGAFAIMLIGTIGTSVAFSAFSFAFAWPLLFSLLAIANWFYYLERRKNPIPAMAGFVISGSACIVILGPSILLGLFGDQLSLALVFLLVLCGFLVPQIHLMLGRTPGNQVRVQKADPT